MWEAFIVLSTVAVSMSAGMVLVAVIDTLRLKRKELLLEIRSWCRFRGHGGCIDHCRLGESTVTGVRLLSTTARYEPCPLRTTLVGRILAPRAAQRPRGTTESRSGVDRTRGS